MGSNLQFLNLKLYFYYTDNKNNGITNRICHPNIICNYL
jgi:hypothetical protein